MQNVAKNWLIYINVFFKHIYISFRSVDIYSLHNLIIFIIMKNFDQYNLLIFLENQLVQKIIFQHSIILITLIFNYQ